MELTVETLQQLYPDIYGAVEKAGHDAGYQEGIARGTEEGRAAGAAAERSRIKAIEDLAIPGHEALIAGLKFDGTTTAAEAAVQIVAAEKKVRSTVAAQITADAIKPVTQPDAGEQPSAAADVSLPLEERAKKEWDKNEALRAEFAGCSKPFEAYIASLKATADGRARVISIAQATTTKGGK